MSALEPQRYCTRALPASRFLPGRTPRPANDERPVPYVAPEQFAASEAFLFGVDLFNHGFYWEAHESWEGLWRRCVRGQAQHQVLQGLIQIAAAYLKRALGEAAPASDLLERGCARLEQVAAQRDPFHGFAVRAFATACRGSQEQAPRLVLVDS